jgi:predicted house-cleaning noncanonical NTP pyrophosphatase (MazG superfamily)
MIKADWGEGQLATKEARDSYTEKLVGYIAWCLVHYAHQKSTEDREQLKWKLLTMVTEFCEEEAKEEARVNESN